ncbi:MAG: SpoIIE family protein phosphatase [Spirochaetes bacterium]|nr:SpoIIE family protein phosphatase [Spirochaetota bacterium]
MRYYVVLLLAILTMPLQASALTLGQEDSYTVPFEILRDPAGTVTLEQALASRKFAQTDRDAYGFINDVIWARFTVTIPEGNTKEWFLEIGYPLLNSIDIYTANGGNRYEAKHFGNRLPFDKRDINHHNFLIRIASDPGTHTYYLRFRTQSTMNIPMTIRSLTNVIAEINTQKTVFGIFYGALLLLMIYNLLLAIWMKDVAYLAYSAFIISLIFGSLQLNGYGFQYLWKNTIWMNDLTPFSLFLQNACLTVFSIKYIDPRVLHKYFIYIFRIYLGTIVLLGALSLFFPYHIMIMVGAAAFLPGILLVTVIAANLIRKKMREAVFYTIAWSFLFAGVIVTVANRFGLLPNHFITLWGFQIGTLFSISLFSLGLADRVNTLKNNLAEINLHLEEKVEDRTRELSHAKDEVEAAMEELEATNERLTFTNRELEDAQAIYRKDMSMAAHLQTALLPKSAPFSPLYDIAMVFIPKSGVSGDFYDFFIDNETLAGLGIFDVSGHGIAPGLLTLMAKSIISATFLDMKDRPLGEVVDKINERLITEIKEIDNYLTGVILRFKDDQIEYINCAHPDIICRKNEINKTGKVLDKSGERVGGPFLGIDTRTSHTAVGFKEIVFKLKSGDTLLLFTDSLTESTSKSGEEYGEMRTMQSLHDAHGETAQELLNSVIGNFFQYLGTKEMHDDLTVILVRKK